MKIIKTTIIVILIAVLSSQVVTKKTANVKNTRTEKNISTKEENMDFKDYTLQLDGDGEAKHGFMPTMYKYHQAAMFTLWCPVTDFAVTIAMYFKYKTQWYQDVHAWLMFTVDIGTILFGMTVWIYHMTNNAAAVQIFRKFSIYIWFKFAHGILVFFLMAGCVVVHVLGAYVKWYGSHCKDKLQPFFWKAKRWHKCLTKYVYVIAKIMIFSGCYLQTEEGYPWPWHDKECPYYDVLFLRIPSISILWFIY